MVSVDPETRRTGDGYVSWYTHSKHKILSINCDTEW